MDAGAAQANQEIRKESSSPPVPIKTYQWEEIRRARRQGGYPWTYLDKPALEDDEITAESILKDTLPKMSRNSSKDRNGRKTPEQPQKILMLDSSPGSSRKLAEGEDDSINIPHFSKEVSLDSEDDVLNLSNATVEQILPDNLRVMNAKVTLQNSPKSILKRKYPEKAANAAPLSDESPRNSKCCHPLVEKIKHIADKTINKVEKPPRKDVSPIRKDLQQEIINLDNSPGTERRERRKAAELDRELESEEHVKISFVMQNEANKEHEYEDMATEDEAVQKAALEETKSGDSKDPSLMMDEPMEDEVAQEETIKKLKTMYDTSMILPPDEDIHCVVVHEVDSDDSKSPKPESENGSPKLTITEILDEDDSPTSVVEDDAADRKVHFDVKDNANDDDAPSDNASNDPDDFWSNIGDHEYEPVGKPVLEAEIALETVDLQRHEPDSSSTPDILPETPPPPVLQVSTEDFHPPKEDDASSTTSHERQFLRPSTDEDHSHFDSFSDPTPDQKKSSAALQKQIEDRYFRDTPTTPESKTDCEISTSQVDSSALENLPLKKENRKRSSMSAEASKLQQRIKAQTGKIKTKLKTIKKPQFNMPERPKFERPKFTMPERPKFNLPERPKFNLPERPKFNMPERPKFNMPERPKFNLPERPKFNMPERPKINFPDKSKFKLPNRPKFNFPERPKFNFAEKAKFTLPDRSKFKLPDRPKIFSSFSKNKENDQQDSEATGETSSTPKKKILDFDFRTYPRFSKFRKEKKADKSDRPGTPPPTFYTFPHAKKDRKAVMGAAHWEDPTNRSTEEEPRNYGPPKSYPSDSDLDFESKLARVDKDYNEMQEEYKYEKQDISKAKLENAEIWNAMEKNSVQRLEHRASLPCEWPMSDINDEEMDNAMAIVDDDRSSAASVDNHRRGVLEEINNDEFFLRQKGISQDNIEVGKYLTDEIRDAFRSPVNALHQLNGRDEISRIPKYIEVVNIDNDDFKQSDDYIEQCEDGDLEHMMEHDDGYYTFPPIRPSRSRKLKTKNEIQRVEIPKEIITSGFAEEKPISLPPKFQEVPKKHEPEKEELPKKSKFSSAFKDTEVLDNLNEYENEIDQTKEMPLAPKRRKRSSSRKDIDCSEDGSLFNGSYEANVWAAIKNINDKPTDDEIVVYRMEYVVPVADSEVLPEESPLPPRRSRTRSRGSRTASVCDDDRTSRGAESLTLDSHMINTEFSDFIDDVETYPGYAVVEKVSMPKKPEPPPRPSAPVRRHRSTKSLSGDRQYFTVPRSLNDSSPPRRPLRNYSTLGPSRPPRKKSSTTSLNNLQPSITQSASNLDTTQYVEIDDEELEAHKDLKSGEVLRKMKYRPLPPPPRPPRGPKKKKDSDDKQDLDQDGEVNFEEFKVQSSHDAEIDIERLISRPSESIQNGIDINDIIFDADINVSVQNDFETVEDPDIEKLPVEIDLPVGILNVRSSYIDYDNDEIVEIEVSTQTDPLPDDFDYTIGMDEPFPEIKDMQIDAEEQEDNSIDAEIFTKGLQRFRESSRPGSRSSRPRTPIEVRSAERPKTPLERSMSPTAILVERRVSSPTRINERDVMVTEASLTVIPIEEPEPKPKLIQAEPIVKHSPIWEAFNAHNPIETIMETEPVPPPRKSSIFEERCRVNTDNVRKTETTQPLTLNANMEVLRTQKLQVSDLEVERLNVGELSASKILVSEIEGLSLQVTDINSKSGNIVVRGIEIAPGMIDELLQRFANMAPPSSQASTQTPAENIQTEIPTPFPEPAPCAEPEAAEKAEEVEYCPGSPPIMVSDPEIQDIRIECQSGARGESAPERPPPPNIPFAVPYFTGYPEPPPFYRFRQNAERSHGDFSADSRSHEGETSRPRRRRARREPLSSSDDDEARPASRRQATRTAEPSIQDLSSQLLRACQNSMGRTLRYILQSISSNFGSENKKDMQMALVIVLVMIAGLILLGVGDGRTVHHHHWDFYNPPSNDK